MSYLIAAYLLALTIVAFVVVSLLRRFQAADREWRALHDGAEE